MSTVIFLAVTALATTIVKLLAAGDDKAMQEEALMEGAEAIKRSLDAVKFDGDDPPPPTEVA